MAISVKLDQKSVEKSEKLIREAFKKVIANKQMLNEVGVTIVTDVVRQTRSGKRADGSKIGPAFSEKSNWVEIRGEIKDAQGAHPAFRQAKPNVTLSGQLLDNFKHFVNGPGKILLRFVGSHDTYKVKRKRGEGVREIGEKVENKDLAKWMNARFNFLGVRDKTVERCRRIVIAYIRRSSKVFRKLNE